jgi:hypothetical protein
MDPKQFDTIARVVGNSLPRRSLLKALGGGLVGTLAGVVGAKEATVAHKRRARAEGPPQKHCKFQGYACRNNTNCCSLNCCNRVCCGEGQTCVGGQCTAGPPPVVTCSTGNCQPLSSTNTTNTCGSGCFCKPDLTNGAGDCAVACNAEGVCDPCFGVPCDSPLACKDGSCINP